MLLAKSGWKSNGCGRQSHQFRLQHWCRGCYSKIKLQRSLAIARAFQTRKYPKSHWCLKRSPVSCPPSKHTPKDRGRSGRKPRSLVAPASEYTISSSTSCKQSRLKGLRCSGSSHHFAAPARQRDRSRQGARTIAALFRFGTRESKIVWRTGYTRRQSAASWTFKRLRGALFYFFNRLQPSANSYSCFSECINSRGLPTQTDRAQRCASSILLIDARLPGVAQLQRAMEIGSRVPAMVARRWRF